MAISPVLVSSYFCSRFGTRCLQELVGESRVSHPTPDPRAYNEDGHFGWSTKEEMEADLKRVDAMVEEQEVTSLPRPDDWHEEFTSSVLPDSVKPPYAKFISHNNMKKSVAFSPAARMQPWVDGALTVIGKPHKENMDLKQQNQKLEEENHILKGNIAKNIASPPLKKET